MSALCYDQNALFMEKDLAATYSMHVVYASKTTVEFRNSELNFRVILMVGTFIVVKVAKHIIFVRLPGVAVKDEAEFCRFTTEISPLALLQLSRKSVYCHFLLPPHKLGLRKNKNSVQNTHNF